MTNKVQKIREEVEKLKSQLLRGACSSQIAMETMCKEEAYNEVLAILDTMQEEPAPKVFEDMLNAKTAAESLGISQEEHDKIVDKCLYGKEPELVDEDDLPNKKEEPVSDELDIAIGEYCSNPDNFITYIDVAFAYRSEQKDDIPLIIKAIKFGAKWQKEQMMKDAFVFEGKHNTACVLASECLRNHGWFQRERDFNALWRYISTVKELFSGEFNGIGKTKIVVIKYE